MTIALNLLADVRWRGKPVAGDRPQALLADAVRIPGDVHAEHPGLTGVDRQQRRQHLAYVKVDSVDRTQLAKAFD